MARLAIENEERIAPDLLVPEQFFPPHAAVPERALMAGVLLDAIDCFLMHCGTTGARHRLFEDAERWIMDTDVTAPLSFENVCDFLSLDADCLRHGLRRCQEQQRIRRRAAALARHWPAQGGTRRAHAGDTLPS